MPGLLQNMEEPKINGKEKEKKTLITLVSHDINLQELQEATPKFCELLELVPEEKEAWRTLQFKQYDLQRYVEDSLETLELKLVRSVDDVKDEEAAFAPEMSYQIFGETERLVGYKGLKMQLYYTAGSLATYFNFKYDEKAPQLGEGADLQPDDITGMIAKFIQPGFHTNMDSFIKEIDKEGNFKPMGEMINQFSITSDEDNSSQTYEVYCVDVVTCPEFRSYHERLQTFLMWYIEAASFIDIDDEKWKFFLMFEKYMHDGRPRYAIVGYITVYEFYCYPTNLRPRISQMLVLPPFQGCGLGAELLETVCQYYRNLTEVTDISVESPSEDFQRLRDYVDCKACASLPSFAKKYLKKGFSPKMEQEAKEKLRISKKQATRVYNILRLGATNQNIPHDMDMYVDSLKKQVDKPHQMMVAHAKRKHLFEKLSFKQILEAMPSLNESYRESLLNKATEVMLEQFRAVLERLERE